MWSSREPPEMSRNDYTLGKGLWTSSAHSNGCQAVSFHCDYRLLIFKTVTELEKGGWDYSKLKHHKAIVPIEIQLFFLKNGPCFVASLFLIFRVLKKLSLTIFASFLFAFMEERIFNGPYSIIFPDITGFYILIFIFFNSGILIGSLSNLLVFVSILPILFNNLFFVTLLLP